jgi:hypothetical protein
MRDSFPLIAIIVLIILGGIGSGVVYNNIRNNPAGGPGSGGTGGTSQQNILPTGAGRDNTGTGGETRRTTQKQGTAGEGEPPQEITECREYSGFKKENILIGFDPPPGGSANSTTDIRVWVGDGEGAMISKGATVAADGRVTHGDINAKNPEIADPPFLWGANIYLTRLIAPSQPGPFAGDFENGGTPYPVHYVKGHIQNADKKKAPGNPPPIDDPTGYAAEGGHGQRPQWAELIWKADELKAQGIVPGTYRAQFVVGDGDFDQAINCITINIQ